MPYHLASAEERKNPDSAENDRVQNSLCELFGPADRKLVRGFAGVITRREATATKNQQPKGYPGIPDRPRLLLLGAAFKLAYGRAHHPAPALNTRIEAQRLFQLSQTAREWQRAALFFGPGAGSAFLPAALRGKGARGGGRRHAYAQPGHQYRVEIEVNPERLRLVVVDSGGGFLRADVPEPDEERPGGRGIWLIEQLASRIQFHMVKGGGSRLEAKFDLR